MNISAPRRHNVWGWPSPRIRSRRNQGLGPAAGWPGIDGQHCVWHLHKHNITNDRDEVEQAIAEHADSRSLVSANSAVMAGITL